MAVKFMAGVDLQNQRAINVASPSAATDAVNKTYVDNLVQGLSWKQAVRAATTANGAIASAYANGSVIDGVTLATGDRILIKNQTTASENGIYVVAASGAPARAADADTGAELVNASVYISEGTTQADQSWTCTTNAPITLGTTGLTFAQAGGGGGTYTAGNGLSLASTQFSVVAGSGITVGANVAVDTAIVVRKYAANIGDGTTTAIAVTHSLGTKDITWSLQSVATGEFVYADAVATSTTVLTLTFSTAPTSGQYRVTVHG